MEWGEALSWLRTLSFVLALSAAAPAIARIPRDRAEVRDFRYEQPCPANGLRRGACPGWQVDHITPLCAGGADKRENMQWISVEDHRFKTLVDARECRRQRAKAVR